MSSDWQAGDLAVCVDDSPCREHPKVGVPFGIRQGAVFRVREVGLDRDGDLSLHFVGKRPYPGCYGFAAERFRKIRPDEQDACEPEFVTLIKRAKRTVTA